MNFDIEKVKEFISNEPQATKIYVGCDSEVRKLKNGKWIINYYSVCWGV